MNNKKKIIFRAIFLPALLLVLSCSNKSAVEKICKSTVGIKDVESCKKIAQKMLDKSSLTKKDFEQVAKNVSNVSEYEKNKLANQLNAAVVLITDALLAFNESAKKICERMDSDKNLRPEITIDTCTTNLRRACENEEEFAISVCAKTAAFCDEFFLGALSTTCKDETNRLFLSLIVTKEKKTCELAKKTENLLPSFDVVRCEHEIASGRCDTDDLSAINNCLKDINFCSGLFMERVRKKCLNVVRTTIALATETEELKTCQNAENKEKLSKGIDVSLCQRLLSDGKCGRNDLFSITNCLDNDIFCRNFFFGTTSATCMDAFKKAMALAISL